ncbi:MAG TPA: 50S ribosomal protein L24 [Dehalococcoidia bacterium]|nr:50S ribosomal protein L24 [Dehalococcoidia bacterium]
MNTLHVKRDDTVMVIAGKDKGKTGKIRRAFPKENRVLIEGVNITKRHMKARPGVAQSGIIEREAPIHVSNVMLICQNCNRPTRTGHQFQPDGAKDRVCKRCGRPT